jgi:UDP-glucuronate 4-epimerase
MKILVTGSSGFIGSALCMALLEHGHEVIGIDNHNNYYDPSIKEARLARYRDHPSFHHYQEDISDSDND